MELCLVFPLVTSLLCIHVVCSICVFSLYVCVSELVSVCMCMCLGDCSDLLLPSRNEGYDSRRWIPL